MSHQAPIMAAMNLLPFARPRPKPARISPRLTAVDADPSTRAGVAPAGRFDRPPAPGPAVPPAARGPRPRPLEAIPTKPGEIAEPGPSALPRPGRGGRARPGPGEPPLLLDRVEPAPAVLTIAISSRALFDLEESHRVFTRDGVEAYARYQAARETEALGKGPAFAAVRKLLALNEIEPLRRRVDVVLLSRNSVNAGLRVLHSIARYGLDIRRAVFAGGMDRYRYLDAFGADLFLSADGDAVRKALRAGHAAATLLPSQGRAGEGEEEDEQPFPRGRELRIAFDGDAVLFSDEAERVYRTHGLDTFVRSEQAAARQPLSGGPFRGFLAALHRIQAEFGPESAPVRTALVTSRATPAHERVVRTLRAWGIRIDEALFLGGAGKREFLRAFGADVFFDDQRRHCDAACGVAAIGHVPNGVANEEG